jgi:hypothetical protein
MAFLGGSTVLQAASDSSAPMQSQYQSTLG